MKLKQTKINQLLLLGVALMVALSMHPAKAHAQTMDNLEANIPFEFHAGNSTLPPGKYFIQTLEDSNLMVMKIVSADGSTSTFFDVHSVEADSVPATNELIFNKYGNQYFLAKLFDAGNQDGEQVVESRSEKQIGVAVEAEEHVTARHRG